jgi:hypothetical protein
MTKFIDDEENFNDGILKDGKTISVRLMMKDGSPNPRLSPVQRAIAATRDTVTFDAARHKPGPGYASATNDAAANDARAIKDAANEEYKRWITDAWKSKAPPAGAYPANGANEGDSCTIDGAPGTLRAIAGHDGWLQCVADTNNDSRCDAQQTMDAAYAEYDLRIQNSWRNQS